MVRPLFIAALLAGSLAVALPAFAASEAPYTAAAFAASQQAGRPILVEITAPWCPICAKQKPILAELFKEPAMTDLVVYQVDFDSEKDIVRAFGANKQSTLIVFHGTAEKGRSTGETQPEAIKSLVAKANS